MSAGLRYTLTAQAHWASPDAAATAVERAARWGYSASETGWAGLGYQDALTRARRGDAALASRSERLLAALGGETIETPRRRNTWDVVGAFPSVPRVLAGADPRVMRRRVTVQEAQAPLRIYVDLCCSGGVGTEEYMTRGAAVLALVRVLSTQRPLELYACGFAPMSSNSFGPQRATLWTCRLPTAPLDLALVAGWLAHQAVFRALFVGFHYQGTSSAYPVKVEQVAAAREAMHLAPQDLYLCGAFLGSDMLRDPIAWVKKTIAELSGEGGE